MKQISEEKYFWNSYLHVQNKNIILEFLTVLILNENENGKRFSEN